MAHQSGFQFVKSTKQACYVVLLLAFICLCTDALQAEIAIGSEVPDFKLSTLGGEEIQLSEYFSGTVILEWVNPDCPEVRRLYEDETMKDLRDQSVPFGMKWFIINSTHYMTPEKAEAWAKQMDVDVPILVDRDGLVGKAFAAKTTPHLFLIQHGRLVYRGAVDNDPVGENPRAKRHSYIETAIRDVHEKRKTKVPITKPYGCTVKYDN